MLEILNKSVAAWLVILVAIVALLSGFFLGQMGKKTFPEKEIEIIKEREEVFPEFYKNSDLTGFVDVIYRASDQTPLEGRIYFPLDHSKKYPALIWCHGWTGNLPNLYENLENAAKQEYITAIFEVSGNNTRYKGGISGLSGVWAEDIKNGISYLIEESPVKNMVDEDKIGIVGHSLGGIAISAVAADDPRVKAAVSLSVTDLSLLKDIDIPFQVQTADFDFDGVLTTFENVPSYLLLEPPKQLIVIQWGTHSFDCGSDETHFPLGWFLEGGKPAWQEDISQYYLIAWFDYYLKGEESAKERIITPTEHLSTHWYSRYNLGDGEKKFAGPNIQSDEIVEMSKVIEINGGDESELL
jgi:dienelactone hydrolase